MARARGSMRVRLRSCCWLARLRLRRSRSLLPLRVRATNRALLAARRSAGRPGASSGRSARASASPRAPARGRRSRFISSGGLLSPIRALAARPARRARTPSRCSRAGSRDDARALDVADRLVRRLRADRSRRVRRVRIDHHLVRRARPVRRAGAGATPTSDMAVLPTRTARPPCSARPRGPCLTPLALHLAARSLAARPSA